MGQPDEVSAEDPWHRRTEKGLDARYRLNEFGETVSLRSAGDSTSQSPRLKSAEEIKTVGRYEVQAVLGRGGFGAVYRGYDRQLDRPVAIKVPLLDATPEVQESLLREARQLARLTHPGIVTVFDVGVDQGLCYIVSDYLDGENLNHWIARRRPEWQETVRVVATVADALAAAHSRNTVHRDVKPANVIVTQHAEGPVPILVDFGLAVSDTRDPRRGDISGTPNYMSPEQARGDEHQIDGRTDIYSLGVILYRMLSGRLPFQAPSATEVLQRVIEDEPQPPRQLVHGVPRELERICLKAMAKNLGDRYTTAGDMAAELRALLRQHEAEQESARAASQGKEASRAQAAAKILIADDHELSRFKLQTDLEKWGHRVTVAADGEEAWQLFQQDEFSMVITDWMMPKVDGLELVRRIRGTEQSDYVYVIMLTAKSEMHDIVSGMGAGADDFLTKPFHRDELQVRLRAGTRLTRLNRELNETNRRLRRSLEAAARIQRSFLPSAKPEVAGYDFAWDHRPCVELGGDMLNIVPLDERHLALYVLDASGEGVPAALLATSLSRVLSPPADPTSLLAERGAEGHSCRILEPREVARRLNGSFAAHRDARQFFTLVYGVLDLESREFCFTSAGHPPVLHLRGDSSPTMLDLGGYPIGMAPADEDFQQQSVGLSPGDRLLMYSDGLPDTINPEGEVFGAANLLESVSRHQQLPLEDMIRAVLNDLVKWRGDADAKDDASILAIEVA